jgi:hypothetical protein
MIRKYALVLSVALVAVTLGCNTVPPPNYGRNDPHDRAQVHFATKDLENRTAVGQVQFSRDESGLLYATVPVRATKNQYLYVEYKATFFDRNGQVVSQTTWLRKDLAPNVPDQVSANSTSNRADDVQIDFRWAGMRRD